MIIVAQYLLRPGEHHLDNAGVRVVDGRIADVGTAAELRERYPYDEFEDFGMAVITPGFVNAHTHLEYTVMDGIVDDLPYNLWKEDVYDKDQAMTDEDWNDSAMLGAVASLRSGITAFSDVTRREASVLAARATGLHGVIFREVNALTRDAVADAVSEADDDIHRWRGMLRGHCVRVGIGPGPLYSTHPDVLTAISDYGMGGTAVAVHVAASREECDFFRYGTTPFFVDKHADGGLRYAQSDSFLPMAVSPVRYALNWGLFYVPNVMAIHCVHLNTEDIDRLYDNDVRIAICPRSNARLGCGVSPLIRFLDRGLTVGLGTNSPAASGSIDMLEEMRFTLMLERAIAGERYEAGEDTFLSAKQMVNFSTIGAARAIGLDDEVGSIEVGKRADLTVHDLSSSNLVHTASANACLVHDARSSDVLMTMVDGKPLYRHDKGLLVDVDEERLRARAVEIRAKLRRA